MGFCLPLSGGVVAPSVDEGAGVVAHDLAEERGDGARERGGLSFTASERSFVEQLRLARVDVAHDAADRAAQPVGRARRHRRLHALLAPLAAQVGLTLTLT